MAKLLVGAVPADKYAQDLVDVALRPHIPRCVREHTPGAGAC